MSPSLKPTSITSVVEDGEPKPTPPRRVLLVDDHPTFRQGLKFIVTKSGEFDVCGEADNAPSAISQCRKLQPDVVVVDVTMPGINGIELIKMILAEMPRMPILVVSMHEETHYALRALKAGAKGYVMKAEAITSIESALRRVADGKVYVSPTFGEQLIFKAIQAIDEGMGSPVDVLSDRELEVLEKLGKGLTTREVADDLRLSPKTVETHRAHIKEKLKFKDATSLVRFAVDWVNSGRGDTAAPPPEPAA
jgi:DNA-binding NarL/FixJ family response regulator